MALNLQQGSNKINLQLLSCLLIAETRLFKATWQQLPQAVFRSARTSYRASARPSTRPSATIFPKFIDEL